MGKCTDFGGGAAHGYWTPRTCCAALLCGDRSVCQSVSVAGSSITVAASGVVLAWAMTFGTGCLSSSRDLAIACSALSMMRRSLALGECSILHRTVLYSTKEGGRSTCPQVFSGVPTRSPTASACLRAGSWWRGAPLTWGQGLALADQRSARAALLSLRA